MSLISFTALLLPVMVVMAQVGNDPQDIAKVSTHGTHDVELERERASHWDGVPPLLGPVEAISMLEVVADLHLHDETTPQSKLVQLGHPVIEQPNLKVTDNSGGSSSSKSFRQLSPIAEGSHSETGVSTAREQWLEQQWHYYWNCLNVVLLIKAACMMSNVVVQLSPYESIKKIRSDKNTGDFDAAPLVSIAFGCVQWSFYGIFAWLVTGKAGFLIVVYANAFGAFVGIFYVVSYHTYCQCQKTRSKLFQYYQMVGNLIIIQACAIWSFSLERALLFCGAIASMSTIVSALAPWTAVPTVISTRSSDRMPVPLLAASLVSSGLWCVCGLVLWDVWIMVPNIVGMLSNVLLVVIALMYQSWASTQLVSKEEEKPKKREYDVPCTLDEKLPVWSPHKANLGSSGGTF